MKQRALENQIWVAYNHVPGGQIGTAHFEDIYRDKKEGDTVKQIFISSKDQLATFKNTESVALNMKGKGVIKNQVLVYTGGRNLTRDPKAADIVTAWAIEQGLEPIRAPKSQEDAKPYEHDKRLTVVEGRIDSLDTKLDKVLEAVSGKKQ